jgi:cAMP-dependent protein kinase regulator
MMKYERAVIADALEPAVYADNASIVQQGDPGEIFFIIVEGQVKVVQTNLDGATVVFKVIWILMF